MNTWTHDIPLPESLTGAKDSFIRLRQPTNSEWKTIFHIEKTLPEIENDPDAACDALSEFCQLLKTLIVKNNIVKNNDDKGNEVYYSAKEIAEKIDGDIMLTTSVLKEYFMSLPLVTAKTTK